MEATSERSSSGYVMFVRADAGLVGILARDVLFVTHANYVYDKYFGLGVDVVLEKPGVSIRVCGDCGKVRMRAGNAGPDICSCRWNDD